MPPLDDAVGLRPGVVGAFLLQQPYLFSPEGISAIRPWLSPDAAGSVWSAAVRPLPSQDIMMFEIKRRIYRLLSRHPAARATNPPTPASR